MKTMIRSATSGWRQHCRLDVWMLVIGVAGTTLVMMIHADTAAWNVWVPTIILYDLIAVTVVIHQHIKRRQRWKRLMQVARSQVCPEWFVHDAMQRAGQEGFRGDFTERFLALEHPPSGLEVARAFDAARQHQRQTNQETG